MTSHAVHQVFVWINHIARGRQVAALHFDRRHWLLLLCCLLCESARAEAHEHKNGCKTFHGLPSNNYRIANEHAEVNLGAVLLCPMMDAGLRDRRRTRRWASYNVQRDRMRETKPRDGKYSEARPCAQGGRGQTV